MIKIILFQTLNILCLVLQVILLLGLILHEYVQMQTATDHRAVLAIREHARGMNRAAT